MQHSRSAILSGVLSATLLLLAPALLVAQDDERKVSEPKSPNDSVQAQSGRYCRGELKEGEAGVDPKFADGLAKWIAYRLTWKEPRGEREPLPGQIRLSYSRLLEEARGFLPTAEKREKISDDKRRAVHDSYRELVGKSLEKYLVELLNDPQLIIRVNAARMLVELARTGYAPLYKLLVTELKAADREDALKLYFCQALRELLRYRLDPVRRPNDPILKEPELREIALALREFMFRPTYDPNTQKVLIEPEVTQFLRREAIRAMGSITKPAFIAANGSIEVSPAGLMGQFAADDGRIWPPPSLSEKVEAVLGLLTAVPDEETNLDFITNVTYTVLEELVGRYNDRSPILPWKVVAVQLSVGLDRWAANVKGVGSIDSSKKQAAIKFVNTVKAKVLVPIERLGISKDTLNPSELPTLDDVRAVLETRPDRLFANDKTGVTSVVPRRKQ